VNFSDKRSTIDSASILSALLADCVESCPSQIPFASEGPGLSIFAFDQNSQIKSNQIWL